MVSGRGTDEDEPGRFHPLGKIGVLGEEAIARVNGLRVGDLGRRDDRRHVEIALGGRRRADAHRLVGEPDVLGFSIRLRMHDHGLDAEFAAGALDAKGNFSAIGNEDFPEHGGRFS
jgi:hypothetical protein